jgi:8-oxo-dGTP pyrophosphatase MutT (NUDIX family)
MNLTPVQLRVHFSQPHPRKTLSLPGYAEAGVLVPLVYHNGILELLFTKRTDTVDTHKGHISFPGGMVEESDENIERTALREAAEEIGLPESSVDILGLLDDMATPTGFVITPVVGVIESLPQLTLNMHEVAEVFNVPLEFFTDPANSRTEMREFNELKREIWFYDYHPHVIWGATAMIVRSLLAELHLL